MNFFFSVFRIEEDEEIEKDVSLADISRNSANEKCVIQ